MSAQFVQPNFTTQPAATYKAAIDAAIAVHHRIAGPWAAHQQDVGSPSPDMSIRIDAGNIFTGGALAEIAAQTVSGFTIPSVGQHRIDRVVLDASTGVASRVAGTAATGSPTAVAPAVPGGSVPICSVLITSSDVVITTSMITDERGPLAATGVVAIIAPTAFPSANAVTISSVPQCFSKLLLEINQVSSDTATRVPTVRVANDSTAANYQGAYIAAGTSASNDLATLQRPNSQTAAQIASSTVEISGYQAGSSTLAVAAGHSQSTAAPFASIIRHIALTAMTSMTLTWDSTGNFDGGTYALYGVF